MFLLWMSDVFIFDIVRNCISASQVQIGIRGINKGKDYPIPQIQKMYIFSDQLSTKDLNMYLNLFIYCVLLSYHHG